MYWEYTNIEFTLHKLDFTFPTLTLPNLTFALQTTRGDFDSSEYEVHRRYQDFLWLRGKLEEGHPTLIIHVGRTF